MFHNLVLENNTKWFWLKIVVLILVCFFAFQYGSYYVDFVDPISRADSPDETNYIAMAERLLEEGVYSFWGEEPDAYVSPGFPLFLSGCMMIFGTDADAIHSIKMVHCVLVGLSVFLVFVLAYLLTKRYSVGLIASLLMALNGSFPFYARYLLTETLFTFMMLLFFVVMVYSYRKEKWWLYFISGILLCSAIMVRPLLIVVFPFIVLFEVVRCRRNPKWLLKTVLPFVCGFIIVGLPWWIRNIVTLGEFVLLATQTNPVYAGLAPDVVALGLEDPGSLWGNGLLLIKLLIEQPIVTTYWMTLGKFSIIFLDGTVCPYYAELTKLMNYSSVCLGLCGCVRALFDSRLRVSVVIFLIYFLSIFLFIPVQRYALAYLPLLSIGAGYLLSVAFSGVKISCNRINKRK